MKRGTLKKKSSLGQFQKQADSLLQRINIQNNKKCESCGGATQVGHHWIEKSRSSNLRYNFDNLIPLCNPCHAKIHNVFGNNIIGGVNIAQVIIKKRGNKWKERMEIEGRMIIKVNKGYYEGVIERLTNLLCT